MFRGLGKEGKREVGRGDLGGPSRTGVGRDSVKEERWAKVQHIGHMTFVNTQVSHAAAERCPGGQAVLLDVSCVGGKAREKLEAVIMERRTYSKWNAV